MLFLPLLFVCVSEWNDDVVNLPKQRYDNFWCLSFFFRLWNNRNNTKRGGEGRINVLRMTSSRCEIWHVKFSIEAGRIYHIILTCCGCFVCGWTLVSVMLRGRLECPVRLEVCFLWEFVRQTWPQIPIDENSWQKRILPTKRVPKRALGVWIFVNQKAKSSHGQMVWLSWDCLIGPPNELCCRTSKHFLLVYKNQLLLKAFLIGPQKTRLFMTHEMPWWRFDCSAAKLFQYRYLRRIQSKFLAFYFLNSNCKNKN